jgi:pyruvate formate lyase activating enzyme
MVYGQPAALHVDPVEKKPLFHFVPGAPILSLGTYGCCLSCAWCQNWELSACGDGRQTSDALYRTPEQIVAMCQATGISLLAFTYNEPAVFVEYARDIAELAVLAGIRCVSVTSGFETLRALAEMDPYLSAVNIDLKALSEETYRRYCGARLAPVLRNIKRLVETASVWVEVTTLVIPGLNDSDEELGAIAQFLRALSPDIPWHVSAFHPDYQMLDRPSTPAATIRRAREIGLAAGLRYVYAGNIANRDGMEDTQCPGCGRAVVERLGYRVRALWNDPARGCCPACAEKIAGVWQ